MRFDGYAGTVYEAEFTDVAQAIARDLGASVKRGSGRRRYSEVLDLELGGRQAAWVGLDHGNRSVYFEGKGDTSPDLVHAVRRNFPEHGCARVDVCEDYDEPGAFDRLVKLVRKHKGPRVDSAYVRLPDDPEKGRTWSAGVRGGVGMVRVYEAGKMRERLHYGRPNWARVELECRPHYARDKRLAATASPVEVWGFSAWTMRVGTVVAGIPIPRFEPEPSNTSHDKRTLYLARTFRRHWEEMLADLGDWECIGRELQQIWREDDEVLASLKVRR
jgi:hypothetical protein